MFGTIAEVKEQIDGGDKQSLMEQCMVTNDYRRVVRENRLTIRRKWAAKRKKLQTLLDVLEMDEPRKPNSADPPAPA